MRVRVPLSLSLSRFRSEFIECIIKRVKITLSVSLPLALPHPPPVSCQDLAAERAAEAKVLVGETFVRHGISPAEYEGVVAIFVFSRAAPSPCNHLLQNARFRRRDGSEVGRVHLVFGVFVSAVCAVEARITSRSFNEVHLRGRGGLGVRHDHVHL